MLNIPIRIIPSPIISPTSEQKLLIKNNEEDASPVIVESSTFNNDTDTNFEMNQQNPSAENESQVGRN